jgi:hypothetical protein
MSDGQKTIYGKPMAQMKKHYAKTVSVTEV